MIIQTILYTILNIVIYLGNKLPFSPQSIVHWWQLIFFSFADFVSIQLVFTDIGEN